LKKTLKLLTLASVLFASSAFAEKTIPLEDNLQILGEWKLYAETPALHKEKKWCKTNGILAKTAS
jgi:hypothetical protein